MRSEFDLARFVGAWRWLVSRDFIFLGDDLSALLGVDRVQGQSGINPKQLADSIHPDDRAAFSRAMERASFYGGEIDLSFRVMAGTEFCRVDISGSCIRAGRGGRPLEYLGGAHVSGLPEEPPLALIADHLLQAAQLVREAGERSLSLFIDMALVELGTRLAANDRALQKAAPRIAVVR